MEQRREGIVPPATHRVSLAPEKVFDLTLGRKLFPTYKFRQCVYNKAEICPDKYRPCQFLSPRFLPTPFKYLLKEKFSGKELSHYNNCRHLLIGCLKSHFSQEVTDIG